MEFITLKENNIVFSDANLLGILNIKLLLGDIDSKLANMAGSKEKSG